MNGPIHVTVGFKCADREAFDVFWQDICTRYSFCDDSEAIPTQAFAVNMGDMFASDEVLTDIMNSDLAPDEKLEAIDDLTGTDDPAAILARWEITPFSEKFA
jgi:hypothetical protein